VCIEQTRHDGAAFEVDRPRSCAQLLAPADLDDAAVLDRERGPNYSTAIDKYSIHQQEVRDCVVLLRGARDAGQRRANEQTAASIRRRPDCMLQQIPP
jgi:hypothetical protein